MNLEKQDMKNTAGQQPGPAKRRKLRPGLLVLDLLIAGLVIAGLYLILKPVIIHKLQDNLTADLIDAYEQGEGTILIDPTALVVEGEEVEYVEENETFSTTATSEGSQPDLTPTPAPTPTAAPAKVVVKAIGRMKIPIINLDMPIAEGATKYNLRVAIGHYSNSSDFGEPGYCIFLGHRMYTYGRHFNRLGEVAPGDQIILEDKNTRYIYQVDLIETIMPADLLAALHAETEEKRIMLVTCTPVRVASHRLLVKGILVRTEPLG